MDDVFSDFWDKSETIPLENQVSEYAVTTIWHRFTTGQSLGLSEIYHFRVNESRDQWAKYGFIKQSVPLDDFTDIYCKGKSTDETTA